MGGGLAAGLFKDSSSGYYAPLEVGFITPIQHRIQELYERKLT
jgi:hypothetical protein